MSDYLDGGLTLPQRRRMEQHLGECLQCRRLLAGLRQTVGGLGRLSAPSDGVDAGTLAASIRARLGERD